MHKQIAAQAPGLQQRAASLNDQHLPGFERVPRPGVVTVLPSQGDVGVHRWANSVPWPGFQPLLGSPRNVGCAA